MYGHGRLTLKNGIQKPLFNPGLEYQQSRSFQSSTPLNFTPIHDSRPMSKSSSDGFPQLNGPLLPNQKVRTTCNACQQAKIRCSHTHPCDRCVSHGFECVYSISQPLGRPAKKKGSRPTQGLQSGRTEGDAAGRPLRRGALGAPKIVTAVRLVTARTRQRLPRQRVAPESSPEARGGADVGTEVTGREGDLIVPGVMETAVEIPGKHKVDPNGQPLSQNGLVDV